MNAGYSAPAGRPITTTDAVPQAKSAKGESGRTLGRCHDLVGEVTYSKLTGPGRMRHPVWRGLRPDKDAAEVVWERP